MSGNPFLRPSSPREVAATAPPRPTEPATGPTHAQRGVSAPDLVDRLPARSWEEDTALWWLGVHGGAGEDSLAAAAAVGRPAQHAWPVTPSTPAVVLVARTNARGLTALQYAARQWAAGATPAVQVIGALLVADAPGSLPRPLRALQSLVVGGVPRSWSVPWVPQWRIEAVDAGSTPAVVRNVLARVTAVVAEPGQL